MNILKKDQTFQWEDKCNEVFKEIKKNFKKGGLLGIYDPKKELILRVDYSDRAMGAELL